MEGIDFGWLIAASYEQDLSPTSGLTPPVGPAEVGHAQVLQGAPNVEGQLRCVSRMGPGELSGDGLRVA
jgi:hypothetical protein